LRIWVKVGLGGLLCLFTLVSRAQDATPAIAPPMLTATISPTATFSPVPTYTATFEPTITPSDTATQFSALPTESPSPTLSPTLEPSPIEVTPEITVEPPTPLFTVMPTTQLPTETVEVTVVDATFSFTPTASPIITLAPSPTETIEILMDVISGRVIYQNHGTDNSGIDISVLDGDGNLIATTKSDANGEYALKVPGQASYQVVIEAFLHRRIQFTLLAGESLPDRVLAGGDLDADGCIGQRDLDLFMSLFTSQNVNLGDITGNGVIDASDFAIVAGNFQNECPLIEPTPISSPLPVSPVPSLTAVESITPTETPTVIEATLSPVVDLTPAIESTITPSLESVPEGN
jgi:hypothetical protein